MANILDKIKTHLSPEKIKGFDKFLDAIPVNVGYNVLIFALSSWVLAGAAILFAVIETRNLTELRTKLLEVEALKPPVPKIVYTPVPKARLESLVANIDGLYPGISYMVSNNGLISISAGTVHYIPQFRAAISHLQNGDAMWKTEIATLCFGRECSGPKLQAEIRFDSVMVEDVSLKRK